MPAWLIAIIHPVTLKQIMPVSAIVPAIFVIAVSSYFKPAVSSDVVRKVIKCNGIPWPIEIPGIIPKPVRVDVIVVVQENHVIRTTVRHIKPEVGQIHKVRPVSYHKSRTSASNIKTNANFSSGIRGLIADHQTCDACH